MGELPPKLFFRIGEVAGLVGVEPHVLRYWEREFRSIRPTKSAKGQRVYSRKDVENLLRVRDLLYRDGFTIAGAKKKLQRGDAHVADHAPVDAADASLGAVEGTSAQRIADDEGAETEAATEPSLSLLSPHLATAIEVASPPAASSARLTQPQVREKLMELRNEVEAFLAELSASGPAVRTTSPSSSTVRAGGAARATSPAARSQGAADQARLDRGR